MNETVAGCSAIELTVKGRDPLVNYEYLIIFLNTVATTHRPFFTGMGFHLLPPTKLWLERLQENFTKIVVKRGPKMCRPTV